MATQEQIDDLVTKAETLSTNKQALADATVAYNEANQVLLSANAMVAALEDAEDTDHLEDLITWSLEWATTVATKATAFNAANSAASTSQSAYDTAFNAIINPPSP